MYKPKTATLVLEDGTEFIGKSFGFEKSAAGEVVFNTAMTGYPESLTDPSYKGQLLISTYPLIGNYGVPSENQTAGVSDYYESDKIQVTALIIFRLFFRVQSLECSKKFKPMVKRTRNSGNIWP